MKLADFDYALPDDLIAQHPVPERSTSRLLHLDGTRGVLADRRFADLPALIEPGDLLVVNDTRVIKARLYGAKASGGRVEVLVERVIDARHALAQIRASHSPRAGATLTLAGRFLVTVLGRDDDLFRVRFESTQSVYELLEAHGELPLPPYIGHAPGEDDAERYQTVYAREPGAVAAPTAGLHFDRALLDAVRARGAGIATVTLHVGAGTFQPVRVDDVADHVMHSESYEVPQATSVAIRDTRRRGGRILAVGTTTLRALEAAAAGSAGDEAPRAGYGETNLFIVPGYRFRVVERLITNFHLPKSTLLMLVSAFGGMDNVRRAYAHAVAQRYRFFSYGDAVLIERQQPR